jgi:hypothetical protein
MRRYQKLYRVEAHDPDVETLERLLNRIARQGWEFVGIMPSFPSFSSEGAIWLPQVVFKRGADRQEEALTEAGD